MREQQAQRITEEGATPSASTFFSIIMLRMFLKMRTIGLNQLLVF